MDEHYCVKLTEHALRDLDRIFQYIAGTLSSPDTAIKLIEEIEKEILSLSDFPRRCALRRIGIYADKGYRQLFIKNYTVIFRIDEAEKTVIVVTVRYSAQKF